MPWAKRSGVMWLHPFDGTLALGAHTFLFPRYRRASNHIAPTPSNPSEKGSGVATLNLVFGAPKLPGSAAVTPNDSNVPVGKYLLSSGGAFVSKTSSSSSPRWAESAE